LENLIDSTLVFTQKNLGWPIGFQTQFPPFIISATIQSFNNGNDKLLGVKGFLRKVVHLFKKNIFLVKMYSTFLQSVVANVLLMAGMVIYDFCKIFFFRVARSRCAIHSDWLDVSLPTYHEKPEESVSEV
jgi:hypothetical protein